MNEPIPRQPYEQKATILVERAYFAAFIGILFALAANGALFLLDQGIAILRGAQVWKETLLALGLLLVGIAVIAVTGLLLVSALQTLRLAWLMEKSGRVVQGRVLKKTLRSEGSKRSASLLYSFEAENHFTERISEAEYQRLNEGDPVDLRILPGHPDIARLEKTK